MLKIKSLQRSKPFKPMQPFKPLQPLQPFKSFKLCKPFQPFKLLQPFERLELLKQFERFLPQEATMHFEDLEVWKLARTVTNQIYQISANPRFAKDYDLRSQIRRAAVSILSNIAEGYERGGNQEFIQFLSIAKGSCGEVRCQLYVAMDQGYIVEEECKRLINELKKLSIMLSNFMTSLRRSPYKGAKYKMPRPKSMKEEMDEILKEFNKKV